MDKYHRELQQRKELLERSFWQYPDDWELLRTKATEYADRIEQRNIEKSVKGAPREIARKKEPDTDVVNQTKMH